MILFQLNDNLLILYIDIMFNDFREGSEDDPIDQAAQSFEASKVGGVFEIVTNQLGG